MRPLPVKLRQSWCGGVRRAEPPLCLKPSARTDIAQLLAGIRAVCRTQFMPEARRTDILRWARRTGLYLVMDRAGFAVISKTSARLRSVLALDQSPGKHTFEL